MNKILLSKLFKTLNSFENNSVVDYMLDNNINSIINDFGMFRVEYDICDVQEIWNNLLQLKL